VAIISPIILTGLSATSPKGARILSRQGVGRGVGEVGEVGDVGEVGEVGEVGKRVLPLPITHYPLPIILLTLPGLKTRGFLVQRVHLA
jgi:hypothetical protein